MTGTRPLLNLRSPIVGYALAIALPVAITYGVARFGLPAFIFEHLVVLLVIVAAIPWGRGPAIVTAVSSVGADNVLLTVPIGRPTITGWRDVLDLLLFATVAVVVSELVRRAHTARVIAEDAAERERRAREDRDRLIATVTHDLATPLSVLSGIVQLARRQGARADIDLSRLLVRIETASARATSLVKTLADAQALESQRLQMHVVRHDLRAVVRPIVEMMDRSSERHPIVLVAPDEPVEVLADGDRLARVIENLLSNATKYSPDGGAIEVSIAADSTTATIRVRDYGIGIAPDALPHIFEASFRAPGAGAHAPGLGLGLSIAAQVVARHGGTIEAAPAEGRGTAVTVRLPLARVPPHDQPAADLAHLTST
jgi:signal transduction histidine kinase